MVKFECGRDSQNRLCSEFQCVINANVLIFVVKSVSKVIIPNSMSRLVVRDSQNRLCLNQDLCTFCFLRVATLCGIIAQLFLHGIYVASLGVSIAISYYHTRSVAKGCGIGITGILFFLFFHRVPHF